MNSPHQNPPEKTRSKRSLWAWLLLAILVASLGIYSQRPENSEEAGDTREATSPVADEGPPPEKAKEPFANPSVVLLGEVVDPGEIPFPLDGGLDLRVALVIAGGLTESGNPRKVRLVRDGKVFVFDLEKMGGEASSIALIPNDRIVVPEKLF